MAEPLTEFLIFEEFFLKILQRGIKPYTGSKMFNAQPDFRKGRALFLIMMTPE